MKEYIDEFRRNKSLPEFFATISLSIIIIFVYLLFLFLSPDDLLEQSAEVLLLLGQVNDLVLQGETYRLFTSMFIHADVIHLISNLIFLLIFGIRLEELTRGWIVFSVFIIGGLVGNIATLLLILIDINFLSLGASGGIYGLLGALFYQLRGKSKRERRNTLYFMIIFFLITIGANTNAFAHFFGLLGGVGVMWILEKRSQQQY